MDNTFSLRLYSSLSENLAQAMEKKVHRLISAWIKELRERKRLTSSDASRILSLPIGLLECFENGAPVPLKILAKILEAYGVSPIEVSEKMMAVRAAAKPHVP